jgi:hypothetical protein
MQPWLMTNRLCTRRYLDEHTALNAPLLNHRCGSLSTSRLIRGFSAQVLRLKLRMVAEVLGRIIDMQIHSSGINLGKATFRLVALGASGKVLVKKNFTQKQLLV